MGVRTWLSILVQVERLQLAEIQKQYSMFLKFYWISPMVHLTRWYFSGGNMREYRISRTLQFPPWSCFSVPSTFGRASRLILVQYRRFNVLLPR